MKRFHIVVFALFAVLAFSAMAASSASAEGPWWIILLLNPEELHKLVWGEEEKFTTEADGVPFVLVGSTAEITCKKVGIKPNGGIGRIVGGNPGTDLADLQFSECNVVNLPNCLAENEVGGIINVSVLTVLVYPDENELENRELALDAFFPDNEISPGAGNDLFVTFELLNASGSTECGVLLNGVKVEVLADGTEVTDVGETGHTVLFDKRCGVLAEVGHLVAGVFEKTLSGEELEIGALNFPETAIPSAFILNANVSLIECSLLAFGAAAVELGIASITLASFDEFGWEE